MENIFVKKVWVIDFLFEWMLRIEILFLIVMVVGCFGFLWVDGLDGFFGCWICWLVVRVGFGLMMVFLLWGFLMFLILMGIGGWVLIIWFMVKWWMILEL